ncbi:unnamed protein product [Didymodactylos carnosus]|uniref:Uncharacterized protein n=1 Tax=Didymodactylos carnosus TaxID=1234261 RepID=A0A8S2DFW5_9BILA|nr:unnamed protein product [Didymodactylos carnosus]CAF3689592.1 unnamed protein product [Didymodactylos carnosus]
MRFNKSITTDQKQKQENIFKNYNFDILNDSINNNKKILIDACETTSKIIDEKLHELKQQSGLLCRVFRRESGNKKNHVDQQSVPSYEYQTSPYIEMMSNLDTKPSKLSSNEYIYTEKLKILNSEKESLEEKCSSWNNNESSSKISLPSTENSKRCKSKLLMTVNNRDHEYYKQQEIRSTRAQSLYEETYGHSPSINTNKKNNYLVMSNSKDCKLLMKTLDKINIPHQLPSSSPIDTLRSSYSTIKPQTSSLDNSDFLNDSPDRSSSSFVTNTNDLHNTAKNLTARRLLSTTSNSNCAQRRYIDLPTRLVKSTHSRRLISQEQQSDLNINQRNLSDYHKKRSRSYYNKNDSNGNNEQFIKSDQQQNKKGHEQKSSSSLNQYTNRIMSTPKLLSPPSNHHYQHNHIINSSSMLSQISLPLSDLIVEKKNCFVEGLDTTHQTESTHCKDLIDTSKNRIITSSNQRKQLTDDESKCRKKPVHFYGHLTTEIQPLFYPLCSKILENKNSYRKIIEKPSIQMVKDDFVDVNIGQYKINYDKDKKIYKNEKISSDNIVARSPQPSSLNNIEKMNNFFVPSSSSSSSSSSSILKQKEKDNIILTGGVVENEITSAAVPTPLPTTMTTNNNSFFSSPFFPILNSTILSPTKQLQQKEKESDEQNRNNGVNDINQKRFLSDNNYDFNFRLKSKHQPLFNQQQHSISSANNYREQPDDQIKSSSIYIKQQQPAAINLNINMSSNNLLLKNNKSASLTVINVADKSSQQKTLTQSSRSKRLLGLLRFASTTVSKRTSNGDAIITTDSHTGDNKKDSVDILSSKKKNESDMTHNIQQRQQQNKNNKDSKFHLKRTSSAQICAQRFKTKGISKRLSADETIVNPIKIGNTVATQNGNSISLTIGSNEINDMKTKLVLSQTASQITANDKCHHTIGNEVPMSSRNGPGAANDLFKYINNGSSSGLLFRPVETLKKYENGNDTMKVDPKTDYVLYNNRNNNTVQQSFFLSSSTAALLPNTINKDIETIRNDAYNKHSSNLTTSLSPSLLSSDNMNKVNQDESNGINTLTTYSHYYLHPNTHSHQQHLSNNKKTKENTNNHTISNDSINSMSTTSNSSSSTNSTSVNHSNGFSTSPIIIKQHNTNDFVHTIVQGTEIKKNEEQEQEKKKEADEDGESMSVTPIKKSVLTLNNTLINLNATNSRQKSVVNAALIDWKIKSSLLNGQQQQQQQQQHDTNNESSIKSPIIMSNNSLLNENNEKEKKEMNIEPGIVLSDIVQAFWHPPVVGNDESQKNELNEQCLSENSGYCKDDLISTTSFPNPNPTTSALFQPIIISSSASVNNVNSVWSSTSNLDGSHNDWTDQSNHYSDLSRTNDSGFDSTEQPYININNNNNNNQDDFRNNNKIRTKSIDNHQDGDGHPCLTPQTKETSLSIATLYEKNRVNGNAQSFNKDYKKTNSFGNGFIINKRKYYDDFFYLYSLH